MNTKQWVAIALAVVVLAIVLDRFRAEDRRARVPAVDASTPEKALKSYWTLRDWMRRTRDGGDGHRRGPDLDPTVVLAPVAGDGALSSFEDRPGTREPLAWSLLRIEPVDETTAHAYARIRNLANDVSSINVTPVELFDTDERTEFRYLMKREGDSWKVMEVWRNDRAGKTTRIR